MNYVLTMTSDITVPDDATPNYAFDGRIVGFTLADGTAIQPQIVIEHHDPATDVYRDLPYLEMQEKGIDAELTTRFFEEDAL